MFQTFAKSTFNDKLAEIYLIWQSIFRVIDNEFDKALFLYMLCLNTKVGHILVLISPIKLLLQSVSHYFRHLVFLFFWNSNQLE